MVNSLSESKLWALLGNLIVVAQMPWEFSDKFISRESLVLTWVFYDSKAHPNKDEDG